MSKNKLFKSHEREIARRVQGQRVGQYGGADVVTDDLAIECKSRKKLPSWLTMAMDQAERNANPMQRAVVHLHEKNNQYDNDLVLMRFSTFQTLYADLTDAETVSAMHGYHENM